MTVVFEGLDLGFGNTKFTKGDTNDIFPSIAVLSGNSQFADGIFKKADVYEVRVGEVEYLVGKEITKLLTNETKVLNRDYVNSDQYKALTYAALQAMGHEEIDFLGVGLPHNNFSEKKGELKSWLEGTHNIGSGKTVTIHNVVVIQQPVAGLINFAKGAEAFKEMKSSRTLRFDFGYFSNDWATCDGFTPVDSLSGASDTGAYTVYQQVMRHLNETVIDHMKLEKLEPSDFQRIDLALRNNSLKICGVQVPLDGVINGEKKFSSVKEVISQVANQAIMPASNNIGKSAKTIDKIIAGGGSSAMFIEALKKAFPRHEISIESDGIYSNANGLKIAAKTYCEHLKRTDKVS